MDYADCGHLNFHVDDPVYEDVLKEVLTKSCYTQIGNLHPF